MGKHGCKGCDMKTRHGKRPEQMAFEGVDVGLWHRPCLEVTFINSLADSVRVDVEGDAGAEAREACAVYLTNMALEQAKMKKEPHTYCAKMLREYAEAIRKFDE